MSSNPRLLLAGQWQVTGDCRVVSSFEGQGGLRLPISRGKRVTGLIDGTLDVNTAGTIQSSKLGVRTVPPSHVCEEKTTKAWSSWPGTQKANWPV